MSLPASVVLKSNANNKFLCYVKEKGPTHAFLRFSQEIRPQKDAAEFLESERKDDADADADADADVEFHFLKFKVEEAKTAQGFVHIRTCYNNKYWVRKSVDCKTIVAEANEPEEDQSKWSCTLFKPMVLGAADDDTDYFVPPVNGDKPQKIQLLHVTQLEQHYVKEGAVDDSLEDGSASSTDHSAVTFTAYNVTVTARLPQYVTFIGHDGRYISNFRDNDLGFMTTDVGAEGVAMEVKGGPFPPYIVLYVRDSNKWWMLNPYSDIGLSSHGTNTSIGPVQVGGHIALHVRANGNFVHRVTEPTHEGTGARISTITEAALLRVGEPVRSREILSADYNLANSRIYDTSSVEKFVDSRTNNTSIEQTGTFQVEYKSSHTTSWNQSLTVHMGIAVSWSVGIPYVGEFGLDISYERTEVSEWGEEKTEEKTVTFTQNVTIPPRKKVTIRVMAMRSTCDVPFTCVVRDVMTNGVTRQYTKTDGLFTGSNEFQFRTIIDEQDA